MRNPAKFRRLVEEGLRSLDLTQGAAARRAEIDPGHLSRAIQGGKSLGKDKVLALAAVLGLPRNELLNAVGYESDDSAVTIDEVSLVRSEAGPPLQIITDARFVDSAVFMWIFSQQPFRRVGMDCELIQTEWENVPRMVASAKQPTIGFYNRRSALRRGAQTYLHVNYWTDLCLYKGYALMARPGAVARDLSLSEAEKYLRKLISERRGSKPTIITIGGDTMWRLYTPLTPVLRDLDFAFEAIPNADQALRIFLGGVGDLFLGGLPQRVAAGQKGCNAVLSFENNPLLFSLNSLIYSEALKDRQGIVSAASGLWFKTIAELKRNPAYLGIAQKGCLGLLKDLRIDQHSLTEDLIAKVLRSNLYEIFPDRPIDLSDELLRMAAATFRQLAGKKGLSNDMMEEVFDAMAETLERGVDKEKYPALV